MITSARIARFRGISDLAVDGFGRVNLIIGKNDCGKTALMEALQVADDSQDAAHYLHRGQRVRLGRGVPSSDFDRFWRPLFYNLDAKPGLIISVANGSAEWRVLEVRQGAPPDEFLSDGDISEEGQPLARLASWKLDLHLKVGTSETSRQEIVATSKGVQFPPLMNREDSCWLTSGAGVGSGEVRHVSELKQTGREGALLELLREVDERLSGIELLAPSGSTAELFVRLDNGTPLLPMGLMGEGFQRCVSLGAAAAAHKWPTIFIDEIENGMHHLVMEPLWRWIATISRERNLQVFATTHSEECIHAACRAFSQLGDEGLRVIRLDRLETGTRAVIYDRTLVETAARTGTEIRG